MVRHTIRTAFHDWIPPHSPVIPPACGRMRRAVMMFRCHPRRLKARRTADDPAPRLGHSELLPAVASMTLLLTDWRFDRLTQPPAGRLQQNWAIRHSQRIQEPRPVPSQLSRLGETPARAVASTLRLTRWSAWGYPEFLQPGVSIGQRLRANLRGRPRSGF